MQVGANNLKYMIMENRVIKFRAWSGEQMVEWDKLRSLRYAIDNDAIQVMQFTGLKDKNGVDIYEGDVIREGDSIGEIKFSEGRFWIDWQINRDRWSDSLGMHYKDSIIIKNIYETTT